jgi:hypothetical protein
MVLLTIKIDSVFGGDIQGEPAKYHMKNNAGHFQKRNACRSGYSVFQNAPWDFMLCKSTSKYTKNENRRDISCEVMPCSTIQKNDGMCAQGDSMGL